MRTIDRKSAVNRENGAALVELVVSLPVLVALLVGIADFARVFYTAIELSNAARAGAQYGAKNLNSCCTTAEHTDMDTTALNSGNIGLLAVASHLCQCATNTGTFSATSPTANNCIDPEATSCPGTHRIISVTVAASTTFTTISPYPGIPRTLTMTRAATLRVTE
jgi:Flp pilus assembly protein TadG